MRKSREEAAETRERIVDTAAHEFGQHGIAETGLADVMAAVGLTHGGFYKHFESKGQLVAEAIEKSMDSQRLSMEKAKGDEALEAIVKAYVSSTHRDNTEEVCPVAALGSELHRADERTRDAASRGIVRLISLIESRLTYLSPKEAKSRAHAILAAMITKLEPDLFLAVTGLTVKDFHLLVRLKVFNTEQMNQAVFAFRRYEDASLRYTGIESHEGLTHYGLYDTVINRKDAAEGI